MSVKHLSRTLGLALVAVLAVGAVMASAALAAANPVWHVNGGTTFTEEAYNATQKSESEAGVKELVATVSGVKVTIVCKKYTGTGKIIKASSGNIATGTFEGCKANVNGCKLKNGSITVEPSTATLVWEKSSGSEALLKLVPNNAEKKFAEFEFIECNFGLGNGKYKVKGEALGEVRPVATEVTTGELIFPGAVITKYWEGEPRSEHTVTTALQVENAGGAKGNVETFHETENVSLVSGNKFGAF